MDPPSTPAAEIESLVRAVNRLLMSRTRRRLRGTELTPPRFHLLVMISKKQPVNMTTLCDMLQVAPSTLTALVDGLARLDLVRRSRDRQDRRVVLLDLSPQGRALIEELLADRQACLHRALEGLSREQIEALRGALSSLARRLETMDWREEE